MHAFDQGKIQILISSSIIESGLDVPGANTLIVLHATQFGLADLYQLRGRVGRRSRQGYAYFLYSQQELTTVQRQRLAALTESARLGSGWTLAQRDLEIRGAGNLMGAEQSGTVNAVGVQLYLDMIQEALDTTQLHYDVDVHVPLTAIIPVTYIADVHERIHHYQLLARATSLTQLQERFTALQQTYGPAPAELDNLYTVLQLQLVAGKCGITQITHERITPVDENPYCRLIITAITLPTLVPILASLGNWVVRGSKLTLDLDAITPEFIRKLLATMQSR